jgi:hypothetical protein
MQGSNGAKVERWVRDFARDGEYQYGMRHCTIRRAAVLGIRI